MQKLLLPNLFQNDNLVKVVNFLKDKEPSATLTVIQTSRRFAPPCNCFAINASQIKKIN